MKLRNKKNGEIVEPFGITCINGRTFVQFDDGTGTFKFEAHSLAELNKEWEDYEEPKKHYFITEYGKVFELNEIDKNLPDTDIRNINCVENIEDYQSIGNYFETEEEAEKAVEKLKAWKRLKDKGIFIYLDHTDFQLQEGSFNFEFKNNLTNEEMNEADKDLDLLFGGEE